MARKDVQLKSKDIKLIEANAQLQQVLVYSIHSCLGGNKNGKTKVQNNIKASKSSV